MPGENILDWSTTAANNATADSSINWAEGMARAAVNDSARSVMAAVAKQRDLLNGSITTTGTANAQAFSSGLSFTGNVPTGLRALLKIGASLTNTSSTTLNMDGIGAVTIKSQAGINLVGGELRAGSYYEFRYDGTNWILLATMAMPIPTNVRTFTSSGTYPAVTDGTVKVLCYVKGGGGGGASSTGDRLGGGGGEGAESWKLTTAAALSGQTVTVGAGGAASGAAGNGNAGTASSIGTIVTANGGSGGTAGHLGGAGGAGGTNGTSDWGFPGDFGHTGGDNSLGTVGIAAPGGGKGGGGSGIPGTDNSGGGGGGNSNFSVGAAGGSGIVVCIEFGSVA